MRRGPRRRSPDATLRGILASRASDLRIARPVLPQKALPRIVIAIGGGQNSARRGSDWGGVLALHAAVVASLRRQYEPHNGRAAA
jgi:hypothetical protein